MREEAPASIPNPKSEYRISKQFQNDEQKSNVPKAEVKI
jgi:hypothetical protein